MLNLGSIVKLKKGKVKLMIINRGVGIKINDADCYFEYVGCIYPVGLELENLYYFNQDNIQAVIFKGFEDEEEKEFEKDYTEWVNQKSIKFTDVEKLVKSQEMKKKENQKVENKLFNNR